jgi:hypothetical protein
MARVVEERINQDGKPVARTRFAILALLDTYYFFFPFLVFFLATNLTSNQLLGFTASDLDTNFSTDQLFVSQIKNLFPKTSRKNFLNNFRIHQRESHAPNLSNIFAFFAFAYMSRRRCSGCSGYGTTAR